MPVDAAGPRAAVIVPCYRDGALVRETLASIQEEEPVEIVVVDDGSDDELTRRVLAELRREGVTVISHESNRGLAATRNTGLQHTDAPYVVPLDSDDLAVPGILARLADLLDAHPEAAVAYGDYQEFGESDMLRAVPVSIDPFRLAYTNEYPQTAMLRRSVLESLGGWNESAPAYEDWDLWLSLAGRGERGVHAGAGVVTHRQRVHGPRMLEGAKRRHAQLYRTLRERHGALFDRLPEHRERSSLSPAKKRIYPLLFGGRRRFAFEPKVKDALDRFGIWRRSR